MAEVHAGKIRAQRAEALGDEGQVVVLHEHGGVARGHLGNGIGEGVVDRPVGRPRLGPRCVEHRLARQVPQAMVSEPEDLVAHDVVGEPIGLRVEGQQVHPEPVGLHDPRSAGGPIAVGDGGGQPGCVGLREERTDAGHQATRAPLGAERAGVVLLEGHRPPVGHEHEGAIDRGCACSRNRIDSPRSSRQPRLSHASGRGTRQAPRHRHRARRSGRLWRASWSEHGGRCDEVPMADGGEGTLEALGGANRTTSVTGPLGEPVDAAWRLDGSTAIIEMARASGLELVGGAAGNDPIAASSAGTGELIAAAIEAGATRVIVGVGGSATTDGGLAALRALQPLGRLRGIDLMVACDVRTTFVDAAEVFAPQKGASAAQVALLRRRLERLAQVYDSDYGVDVTALVGSGAAGGLAGGLAAAGGRLVPGFDLVADEVDLYDRIEGADLVITGEGFLDAQSFEGKVVGGVAEMAAAAGVRVVAIVGEVFDDGADRIEAVSLVRRFGDERARIDTIACIEEVVASMLG